MVSKFFQSSLFSTIFYQTNKKTHWFMVKKYLWQIIFLIISYLCMSEKYINTFKRQLNNAQKNN